MVLHCHLILLEPLLYYIYVCLTPNAAQHSASRLGPRTAGIPALMKAVLSALHLVLHETMVLHCKLILLVLELCWVGNRDWRAVWLEIHHNIVLLTTPCYPWDHGSSTVTSYYWSPCWIIYTFVSFQIQHNIVLLDQDLLLLESLLMWRLCYRCYTLFSTRPWFFTVNSYYWYWSSAGLEIEIEGLSDSRFITT